MTNLSSQGVFSIIDDNKLEKPIFYRIGTAFTNKDGSFNIKLNAYPLNGKLHIRPDNKSKQSKPEAEVKNA